MTPAQIIQARKRNLEDSIAGLLEKFSKETGLEVQSAHISHRHPYVSHPQEDQGEPPFYYVKLTLEL